MLTSIVPRLTCAVCEKKDAQLRLEPFVSGANGHVRDGVLICPGCSSWFPIQDQVLELVEPPLLDPDLVARFEKRFVDQLKAAAAMSKLNSALAMPDTPQMKQRRHFDWFASDAATNYDAYQRSPFWRAADAATFSKWTRRIESESWVLDVGCANGRSAWPFAEAGATLIGCDISRRLVAQAIAHAESRGLSSRTTFIVADADRLPFAADAFDVVVTYGALHHLPDPARTTRDIQRIVKPGGLHFGSENNKSAFRRLFDVLMKIKPLWIEEAGEEPLISEAMVRSWLSNAPACVRVATHVFVPPHLIDALPEGWGAMLLKVTDAIGSRLPFVRANGGLLVFEAQKTAPSAK